VGITISNAWQEEAKKTCHQSVLILLAKIEETKKSYHSHKQII
jgi:hypothetical protein